jgi:hypothetical protein
MQAGGARMLYLGDSHATCLAESQALGLPQCAVTIVPVRVELKAVIDLRDPATLVLLGDPQEEWRLNFRLRQQPTADTALLDWARALDEGERVIDKLVLKLADDDPETFADDDDGPDNPSLIS